MGHFFRTLLWDTVVGQSCGTLVGHSCRKLLWDTLVGHSCRTLLRDTLVRHSCGTLLRDTLVGHSCGTRDCLKSHTRLPPKVTRQVSKTSVSYESSSKSHTSSLQNERFVRDILQNSHVKVCKTSVSYETSSKKPSGNTHRSTHVTQPCQAVSRFQPSKQHPLTRQSQWDSDIHLYHNSQPDDSLRLPRIFPRPHV